MGLVTCRMRKWRLNRLEPAGTFVISPGRIHGTATTVCTAQPCPAKPNGKLFNVAAPPGFQSSCQKANKMFSTCKNNQQQAFAPGHPRYYYLTGTQLKYD